MESSHHLCNVSICFGHMEIHSTFTPPQTTDLGNIILTRSVRWLRRFAAKPDNLNLVFRPHILEGENKLLKFVLCPAPVHHETHRHTHTINTIKNSNNNTVEQTET